MLDTRLDQINFADPALYERDVEAIWAHLRRHQPVYLNALALDPFWLVTRYEDAVRVFKDPVTFTSEKGMRVGANASSVRAASGKMLIVTDPPRHAKIRRLINAAFTPRVIARLEDTIRRTAMAVVEEAASVETCDFVPDVAGKIPAFTVCDMLGVPESDWPYMAELTWQAFGVQTTESIGAEPGKLAAHAELFMYFSELLRARRKEPSDDIVSALANGEVDGKPLTDEEVLLNCDGVINGGIETTRQSAAVGVQALVRHPAQWELLKDDPSLAGKAVEEVLRWSSPALLIVRYAVEEVELAGQTIRAGDSVAVSTPSANRDETIFEDADEFRVARHPNRHITFGIGEHYCLGAALARAELRAMLESLLSLVSHVEERGEPRRLRSNFLWGLESLPVALVPLS